MEVERTRFGVLRGKTIILYTLKSESVQASVMDLGASLQSVRVTAGGEPRELTLGFCEAEEYFMRRTFFGATVGRVANRIAGGEFTLGGKRYTLEKNSGGNYLHGGYYGYDMRAFDSKVEGDEVVFRLVSPDGDQGFPGRLELAVAYRLDGDTLTVRYEAVSDRDTVFAPTLHTFFNLSGAASQIDGTELYINADRYMPIGDGYLPEPARPVKGTVFDFTSPKRIADGLYGKDRQIKLAGGYDHNFVLGGEHAATARYGGVALDVYTDLPGLQLYTGNFLRGAKLRGGYYSEHCAFCLEPQFPPNAINTDGSPVIRAGERVTHYIKYKITAD